MKKWHKIDFEEGYENYSVSNKGEFRNDTTGQILKPRKSNAGYLYCNLYNRKAKKNKIVYIHRMVALYFVKGDKSLIINHKNGIKTINEDINLEWVTYSENLSHAYKTNLRNEDRENNPSNVHKEKEIRKICKILEKDNTIDTKNISYQVFGEYNNKYKSLINHIKAKDRWTSIIKEYNF